MNNNTNPAQLVPYVQAVYNQFKAIGIILPLADLPNLLWHTTSDGDSNVFSTYCEDKLMTLPAYGGIVALGLNRAQTLLMARGGATPLPRFDQLITWLQQNPLKDQIPGHLVQVQLLQIVNDVVSMKP